jgi:hypothetical protein
MKREIHTGHAKELIHRLRPSSVILGPSLDKRCLGDSTRSILPGGCFAAGLVREILTFSRLNRALVVHQTKTYWPRRQPFHLSTAFRAELY